jgi:putative toxin-antitoxin system antitoxin component (TIGR02293 family)
VEDATAPGAAGQGAHDYLALLGLRSCDAATLVRRLREGLAYASFDKLRTSLGVSTQELAEAVAVSPRTLARRRKAGRLLPDESDRLIRLARLFAAAVELYQGDPDGARTWMMRPSRALGGASPFAMARTEVGAREVEAVIGRIGHGVLG